jgi:hypothetical protein
MKTIFYLFTIAVLSLSTASCSKCYDCVETQDILDANGNVIDQTEVHSEVCTAFQDEIDDRESNGATCSQ